MRQLGVDPLTGMAGKKMTAELCQFVMARIITLKVTMTDLETKLAQPNYMFTLSITTWTRRKTKKKLRTVFHTIQ